MTRSMTGFGKASCEFDGGVISVEVSSVNHRYLSSTVRVPNGWAGLEPNVKDTVKKHISRGKIYVNISRRRTATTGQTVQFDPVIAQQYVEASKQLGQLLGSYETLSLDILAQLPGVFYCEEAEEDLERAEETAMQAVTEALNQLDAMRTSEGEALARDILRRSGVVRDVLVGVEERLPALNAAYEERLRDRINELRTDVSISEERIAIEVALLAEKADVTEEVVRLKTHLDHMDELVASEEPIGRRLDFLTQEAHREVNTLGVKTRDGDISREVLRMKAELEKIREQVQNIE